MRLQTLPNTAIGAFARGTDPALMLLAGIDASFDFNFNDYLHSASLCAAPPYSATAWNGSIPDLFHFRVGNFLTSSVIIAPPFPEVGCERTARSASAVWTFHEGDTLGRGKKPRFVR
jgi:hypothetical protein